MKQQVLSTLTTLALCAYGGAHAQEAARLDVSVGLKAWQTEWTTFGYGANGTLLLQVPAEDQLVLIPLVSARYGNFVASLSGYRATTFQLIDGPKNERKEFDVNAGYVVAPGVVATLGYKKYSQSDGPTLYEVAGPTIGVSATAAIQGGFSMYGALGLGKLDSTGRNNVKFDNDYQLTEVGVAYTAPLGGMPRAITFTFGYRMQVLSSKEALGSQEGRDLTQGFALGVLATF